MVSQQYHRLKSFIGACMHEHEQAHEMHDGYILYSELHLRFKMLLPSRAFLPVISLIVYKHKQTLSGLSQNWYCTFEKFLGWEFVLLF